MTKESIFSDDDRIRSLFSPEERLKILERLIRALQSDHRIAGAVVVGSGSVGFEDEYSDIDVVVVIIKEHDVLPVFREWRAKIERLFPVIHSFEETNGPNDFLYGFLLEGFLELDLGFRLLTELSAKRKRWKVAFDHSGKLEEIMKDTWKNKPQQDHSQEYFSRLNSIWYYITHVGMALLRNQPWRAINELQVIRESIFNLIGLELGLEMKHLRDLNQIPGNLLKKLEQTLVASVDKQAIFQALEAATTLFFGQASNFEKTQGLNVAPRLEARMQDYLDICKERLQMK